MIKTNEFIDSRNVELWNFLNSVQSIDIEKQNRSDFLVFTEKDRAIIYVPFDNNDPASFTHELLHIYLRVKGVFISGGLKNLIKSNKFLFKIISNDLIEHIGNCIDHILMFPKFIELGYDANEFLMDFSVNKLTEADVQLIEKQFVLKRLFYKVYSAIAIDFFIGKYFAVMSCPNKTFDYTQSLYRLEKINAKLYKVLFDFSISLKDFDYQKNDTFEYSYQILLFDFIKNLAKWTNGKIIK